MYSVRLALSGGGYRAMLFHVGALWKLNDIGELHRLSHVSSVSGGSITAGVLAMNWRRLTFKDRVATNFQVQIADPVMDLANRTLEYRAGIFMFIPFCSSARALEKVYARFLFRDTTLGTLPETPRFTFNATNLQTGGPWTFERHTMGDPALGTLPSESVPLARAVAASSAFPPLLGPLVLKFAVNDWHSYPAHSGRRPYKQLSTRRAVIPSGDLARYQERVVLVDGGVVDNLGVLPLDDGAGDLCISDGGDMAGPKIHPARNWAAQLVRAVKLIHDQPSELRSNQAIAEMAEKPEKLDGAIWNLHWPLPTHKETAHLPSPNEKEWAALRGTPTRLRAMSPQLQRRLINWGYRACNRSLPYINRLALKPGMFTEEVPFPQEGGHASA